MRRQGGVRHEPPPVAEWSARRPTAGPRASREAKEKATRMPPVHLHHEGPAQGHAAGQGDPQGHLAVVLPRRQDRRPRRQRRGQVTLLRIMAGVDKDFAGEAFPAEGTRIGYLPQEPQLDPKKNVREHVEEAVAAKRAILQRYEELSANYSDETADEIARLQDQIDAQNLWELDRQVEIAMDALRLPPGDADVTTLSGGERRRVALCRCCCSQPDMLLLDEPTNHLDAESVAGSSATSRTTRAASSRSPTTATSSTTWPAGSSSSTAAAGSPGRATTPPGSTRSRPGWRQEDKEVSARRRTLQRELEWIRMAPRARQAKGKARLTPTRRLAEEQAAETRREGPIEIAVPPGPPPGVTRRYRGPAVWARATATTC